MLKASCANYALHIQIFVSHWKGGTMEEAAHHKKEPLLPV